jgi:hypothetical protein
MTDGDLGALRGGYPLWVPRLIAASQRTDERLRTVRIAEYRVALCVVE